jgi:hypothetical protein
MKPGFVSLNRIYLEQLMAEALKLLLSSEEKET